MTGFYKLGFKHGMGAGFLRATKTLEDFSPLASGFLPFPGSVSGCSKGLGGFGMRIGLRLQAVVL